LVASWRSRSAIGWLAVFLVVSAALALRAFGRYRRAI